MNILNEIDADTCKACVKNLQDAVSQADDSFLSDGLESKNSRPFLINDHINTLIKNNASCYEAKIFRSSSWCYVIAFLPQQQLLLKFISKSRFEQFLKNPGNSPQYIQSANSYFNETEKSQAEQCYLFPDDEVSQSRFDHKIVRDCMTFEQINDKKFVRFAFFVYKEHYGQVESVEMYLMDSNFKQVNYRNLSDYIEPTMPQQPEQIATKEMSSIPEISLTQNALALRKQNQAANN